MNALIKKIEDCLMMNKQLEHFRRGDLSDSEVCESILHELFSHFNEDLLEITLKVDRIRKEQAKERSLQLSHGLFVFMNKFHSIISSVENNDIKKLKEISDFTNSIEGIDFYLRVGVALFPEGVDNFSNVASKWLYAKILSIILQNESQLEEGGSSFKFVETNGFYPFIRAMIDLN